MIIIDKAKQKIIILYNNKMKKIIYITFSIIFLSLNPFLFI